MTAVTGIRYESIDDCLGPGAERYFGEGFKKVMHAITDIGICHRPDGGGTVEARGELSYPADWSRKSSRTDLRPHLSSIDALLLGVQLAELYLTHAGQLAGPARSRLWLRRFLMRAGATPQEELTGFPLYARRAETQAAPHTLCGQVSTFDCIVGTVRLRCEIEHETIAALAPSDGRYERAERVLGPAEDRYYGAGYKLRRQVVQNVVIAPDRRQLGATVQVSVPARESTACEGFGAAYQPALSMIDCVAAMAQMAQALLYRQDDVRRDRSNTLWMRRVAMDCKTPYQPLSNAFVTSALIDRTERVRLADSEWRATRMVGDFQGIHAQASMAHQLPHN